MSNNVTIDPEPGFGSAYRVRGQLQHSLPT